MRIELDNLEIRIDDFSLSADLAIDGGITAIIGPSGEGKSTLLLTLAGFILPESGQVVFDGADHTRKPPAKRPVTMLFQENNLFPHLTVFQNIALGLRANLRLSVKENQQVIGALAATGLKGTGERLPSDLSGGQRQRVAIARAMLRDRPILLLDEPFAALGPALRHEMLDLIAEIRNRKNATILMVTHNPDDAIRIADQTIVIANGRASQPTETKALFANPTEDLKNYLGK